MDVQHSPSEKMTKWVLLCYKYGIQDFDLVGQCLGVWGGEVVCVCLLTSSSPELLKYPYKLHTLLNIAMSLHLLMEIG